MQIVIEIPKEQYERLPYIDIVSLRAYIEKGKILPKGHGDLIDRNEVIESLFDFRKGRIQTIIEADKAESEE